MSVRVRACACVRARVCGALESGDVRRVEAREVGRVHVLDDNFRERLGAGLLHSRSQIRVELTSGEHSNEMQGTGRDVTGRDGTGWDRVGRDGTERTVRARMAAVKSWKMTGTSSRDSCTSNSIQSHCSASHSVTAHATMHE